MEKELKAAIIGLENDGFYHSQFWYKLVSDLMCIFEMNENRDAVKFWNNR